MSDELLAVRDLHVEFPTLRGVVHALQGVSFDLRRRETLGLAGETGCGKSVTALAILRLVSPPGRITQGQIVFEGRDLLQAGEPEMRRLRGSQISMIMQEPRMSLNPVIRAGDQVSETLLIAAPWTCWPRWGSPIPGAWPSATRTSCRAAWPSA
jgi:ABC-type dipeptide/oligopeptide/nickel transport system ATPase component